MGEKMKGCSILIKGGYFAWETREIEEKADEFKQLTERNYTGKGVQKEKKKVDRISTEQRPIIEENPRSSIQESLPEERTKNYTILKNINLRANKGEMIAIVGAVGAGKSTLANAMIGETVRESGTVSIAGQIRYLAQTPWIRNDTIRGNIILQSTDEEYDVEKYNRILRICELERDLGTFDNLDMTEVGARGINLSGGQKQRVSIARALYSGADIYIIDDCLSALDAQVSHSVFDNVINGEMGNSTRIFITHAIHLLNNCPQITKSKYSYTYI